MKFFTDVKKEWKNSFLRVGGKENKKEESFFKKKRKKRKKKIEERMRSVSETRFDV